MLGRRALIARILGFVVAFSVLQCSWQLCYDSTVARRLIEVAVVQPAALLANLLTPQVHAYAAGHSLRAAGGGLNIINGCDGIESLCLLLAGFSIAPIPWRARATGALLGIVLVAALNQARILSLFYAYRSSAAWFDLLHGLLSPILMVLCIAGYFHAWLVLAQRSAGHAP
jgi:exosortase/archaeosortase family protein